MCKYKRFFLFLLSLLTFVSKVPVLSYADEKPFFSIASDSNASFPSGSLMSVVPRVVINSVTNTVVWSSSRPYVLLYVIDKNGVGRWREASASVASNGLSIKYVNQVPEGSYINSVHIYFKRTSGPALNFLPPSGKYKFAMHYSSDFSYKCSGVYMCWTNFINNASNVNSMNLLNGFYSFSSGDIYLANMDRQPVIDLSNVGELYVRLNIDGTSLRNFAGLLKVNFTLTTDDSDYTVGRDTSTVDYQNDISSNTSQIADGVGEISGTLSDLSGTMSDMASDTSEIKDTLTYISDSQNLIIEGIDNIILHISDQLYAFWDQLYNLIHVPTYNKLNEILAAIKSMDLDVTVDLDELKAAISSLQSALVDQMEASTGKLIDSLTKSHNEGIANDNKNHDDLTDGFDNSGMDNDKNRLDDAIAEYDGVEDQLLGDAKDTITGFDFENPLTRFVAPLQDISYFLQGVYVALGGLNIPIGFALTLMIALIFVGYYRFKGGN